MIKKIMIEGMTCGHCAMHVEEALKELDGVKNAKVDLSAKMATIEVEHEVSDEEINTAIVEAGYEATKIE